MAGPAFAITSTGYPNVEARPVVIADEQDEIESAIRQLAADGCCLVFTAGGNGPQSAT